MMDKDHADKLDRWWNLADEANRVLGGHELEHVGGTLAVLTAMLLVASRETKEGREQLLRQHHRLVMSLVPMLSDAVKEAGGWDAQYEKIRKGKMQ